VFSRISETNLRHGWSRDSSGLGGPASSFESRSEGEVLGVGVLVARALRNHNVWLVVMYVGLILLMARAYA